jgi:hypothetical protein
VCCLERERDKGTWSVMAESLMRPQRLQVMLTPDELRAIDDFRFSRRMPSRAAAVRELMRRGLAAEGFELAPEGAKSQSFGVLASNTSDDGTPADSEPTESDPERGRE